MANLRPELLAKAEPIFHEAVRLPPDQQTAFLDLKCADNPALRTVLDKLLSHAEDKNGIFTQPENPLLPTPPKPGTQIGHYQLIRSLGRGGMGQVFLARQEEPQRDVAIKLLRADLSDKSLSHRFKLEIEILGRFNHPGIAQIYEAGTTEEGHSYFAMEYVPGKPLTEFVTSESLDPRQRLELAMQICEAVQYAHEQGIIHRDLKPSNIMATKQDDGTIRTRVLDFGVARATGTENPLATLYTIPGQLVGTLAYMSPEQVSGHSENLDSRSDIFQLGVIIYELLAGRLPLDINGMGFADAMRRINEDEPDHLGTVDTFFRGDIETIISKAMAKERELRYCTARELGQDIRRYLDGEAILARPTTTFYRLGKVIQRKRNSILSLAAMAILTSLVAWFLIHEPPPPPRSAPRLTRLTASGEGDFEGLRLSFSPNGKQLAYVQGGSVIFHDLESGETKIEIAAIDDERWCTSVNWLPSGKEVILEYVVAQTVAKLVRFNLTDGTEEIIKTCESLDWPMVSPDGMKVLLTGFNERVLTVLDFQSGKTDTVFVAEEGESMASPAWAPDSKHLVYVILKEPNRFLECIDFSGNRTVLLDDDLLQFMPRGPSLFWLPNGRLLYSRFRDYSNSGVEIWSLPTDIPGAEATGKPVLVHALENRSVTEMAYSPATNTLAFRANLRKRDLVVFDLEGTFPTVPKELETRGWPVMPVGWFNDGQSMVLFEVNSTQKAQAVVRDMVTGKMHSLECSPANARPIGLTSDGKHLVILDGGKINAIPLDCGPMIDLGFEILDVSYGVWVVSSGAASESNYLLIKEGDKVFIHELSLETGIGPRLTTIPLDVPSMYAQHNAGAELSPDGKQLAITEFSSNIKLYNFETGNTSIIPTELGTIQRLRWSWDGQWIYCSGLLGEEHPRWMARVDPITGASELLWTAENTLVGAPFASPDGKSLVTNRMKMGLDLFMLEGL